MAALHESVFLHRLYNEMTFSHSNSLWWITFPSTLPSFQQDFSCAKVLLWLDCRYKLYSKSPSALYPWLYAKKEPFFPAPTARLVLRVSWGCSSNVLPSLGLTEAHYECWVFLKRENVLINSVVGSQSKTVIQRLKVWLYKKLSCKKKGKHTELQSVQLRFSFPLWVVYGYLKHYDTCCLLLCTKNFCF